MIIPIKKHFLSTENMNRKIQNPMLRMSGRFKTTYIGYSKNNGTYIKLEYDMDDGFRFLERYESEINVIIVSKKKINLNYCFLFRDETIKTSTIGEALRLFTFNFEIYLELNKKVYAKYKLMFD